MPLLFLAMGASICISSMFSFALQNYFSLLYSSEQYTIVKVFLLSMRIVSSKFRHSSTVSTNTHTRTVQTHFTNFYNVVLANAFYGIPEYRLSY